jgi:hypothetical protein
MAQALWNALPIEIWSYISQFLREMDTINLFWTLWRESLITQNDIITAYEDMIKKK